MWRYLRAAFFVRVPIPALGRVPVNILALLPFVFLGFGEPGFWLLGLGLDTAFVFTLGLNARFQKVVDAQALEVSEDDAEQKRQALIRNLSPEAQRRMAEIERNCEKVFEVFRTQQADAFVVDASRDAMQRLEWVYLKLLVAQHNLLTLGSQETEQDLARKMAALEEELRAADQSEALRASKSATLATLRERLENLHRKEETLKEIASDLTRIESQVDLTVERAMLQGRPQAISADIELASNLVGGSVFGDSEVAVADLDATYGARSRTGRQQTAEGS